MNRKCLVSLQLSWLFAAACQFDVAVPSSAEDGTLPEIACSADSECPPEWTCNEIQLRCVPDARVDNQAPSLVGEPTLEPAIGGQGQTFTLRFEVSEQLGRDPRVSLEMGTGQARSFVIDSTASGTDGHRYVYRYTAGGNEPEGTRLVTLDLEDLWENRVDDISAGSLMLDFTAPHISAATIEPAVANAADEVALDIELSEPLPQPPLLTLVHSNGSSHTALHLSVSGTRAHAYRFSPSGQEDEGLYTVQAAGLDAAGNRLDNPQVGKLRLDFTAPAVAAARVIPPLAAAGQRVLVEVDLSETLVAEQALLAEPVASGGVTHSYVEAVGGSTLLRFEHTVASGTDGHFRLVLQPLEDEAGNRSAATELGTVEYDTTPPRLASYTQSHFAALASDTLQVRFVADEPLSSAPVVTVGGLAMGRVGTATEPFFYELAMAGSGLVGAAEIQLRLVDRVANTAQLVAGVVAVDAVAPDLVDVVFTPPAARLGVTAVMTVTASEPLAASPTVQWAPPQGDPGYRYLGPSGLGHMWALDVTPAQQAGIYQVSQVTLVDLAGNLSVVDTSNRFAIFEVDNLPPVLRNLSANASIYSARPGHDEIVLSFDGHDPPDKALSSLQVTLGPRVFDCQHRTDISPTSYECRTRLDGSEDGGLNIIALRAVDAAGNESTASLAVQLDFAPPDVVAAQISPARAQLGDTVVVSLTASETLVAAPSLEVDGLGSLDFTLIVGSRYAYSHQVAGGEVDGQYLLSATLTDLVGNSSVPIALGGFQLDASVPQIDNLGLDARVYSAQPGHNLITTFFDLSEPMDSGLLAVNLNGDLPFTCGPYQSSSPSYTCSYAITGTEPEGILVVSVAAVDAAGNSASDFMPAQLDFTPPAVDPGTETLTLTPADNCPRAEVQAVGVGTTVDIGFLVTERLLSSPELTTLPDPLAFALVDTGGAVSYRFAHTLVSSAVTQGPYSATVRLVDAAGNEASITLDLPVPGLLIDTRRPAPPRVDDLLYTRMPWGSQTSAGNRRFVVEGQATGVVEAEALVLVLDASQLASASLLGTAIANAQGEVPVVDLGLTDHERVYVHQVDLAGNLDSASATLVHHGRLLVNLNDRPGGTAVLNPHQVEARPIAAPVVEMSSGTRGASRSALAMADGDAEQLSGATSWAERRAFAPPPARDWVQMVTDHRRGKVVVIGGWQSGDYNWYNDQWEWDGRVWREVFPPDPEGDGNPFRGNGTGAAYDGLRGQIVLYGGTPTPGETWFYDGTSWRRDFDVDDQGDGDPGHRHGASLAYDRLRDRTLLFGDGADTWEWDHRSGNWTNVSPASGPNPGARDWPAMAFDENLGQVVLYGGHLSNNALWGWTGSAWQILVDAGSSGTDRPRPCNGCDLVFDRSLDRLVLIGGYSYENPRGLLPVDEVWMFDGSVWEKRILGDPEGDGGPRPRWHGAAAWDPLNGQILVYGGCALWGMFSGFCSNSASVLDETWSFTGTSWQRRVETDARGDGEPSLRTWIGGAYVPSLSSPVFVGGYETSGFNISGWFMDTWAFDGMDVYERPLQDLGGDGTPAGRYGSGLVYDPRSGRLLVFSGRSEAGMNADTWSWEPSSGDWIELTPVVGNPPARYGHALAHLPGRDVVVLYGGTSNSCSAAQEFSDTWEWDGTDWTPVTIVDSEGDGEPAGCFAAMGYDPGLGKLVLVDRNRAVWLYEGNSWSKLIDGSAPGSDGLVTSGSYMFVDPRFDRFYAIDGRNLSHGISELRGGEWQMLDLADPEGDGHIGARMYAATAWDPVHNRLVVNGGAMYSAVDDDWEWDPATGKRPDLLLTLDLSLVPSNPGIAVDQIELQALAGGDGDLAGVATTGAQLAVWDLSRFISLAQHSAPSAAPAPLTHRLDPGPHLDRLLGEPEGKIWVRVAPVGANGAEQAQLRLDHFELLVDYRLP